MLAKMKKEILDDANSMGIEFAKKCFGSADSLQEANVCVDKGNEMYAEDAEHYKSWSAKDKKEIFSEMQEFEKAIPCVKAAQSMQALQQCFPKH